MCTMMDPLIFLPRSTLFVWICWMTSLLLWWNAPFWRSALTCQRPSGRKSLLHKRKELLMLSWKYSFYIWKSGWYLNVLTTHIQNYFREPKSKHQFLLVSRADISMTIADSFTFLMPASISGFVVSFLAVLNINLYRILLHTYLCSLITYILQ